MAKPQLKSYRFRAEREWDWRRLEGLLNKVERKSASALTDEELLAVPVLYRSALSALSVARATSLDASLIDYLESLCSRAYFFVYGTRSTFTERLARFFRHDWAAAVRSLWRETLISGAVLAATALAGYLLVSQDMDWFYSLMPGDMAQGRDPAATTEFLRGTLYDGEEQKGLSVFATFLFTNNAQVALLAFALGFAFCLPTVLLLGYTGLTLGAFVALFASRGLGVELGGWLLIHGVTELFAVVLAGAAGLRLGWVLAFPGERSRIDAAAAGGRTAATAMAGVVVMLMFAGLLEGFGRQLIEQDAARYAIAAATGVLWLAFYYLPRRPADGR